VVFQLIRVDGRPLPASLADSRGHFTLRAANITLDPDGNLWWESERVSDPDTTHGNVERRVLVDVYQRAGEDSLVFPVRGAATPEFFGRLDGRGGLRLVSHPLPMALGGPSRISVAAEQGGAHVWEFHVP
jgi:hypothetical protein